jgi:hypothetical protein
MISGICLMRAEGQSLIAGFFFMLSTNLAAPVT